MIETFAAFIVDRFELSPVSVCVENEGSCRHISLEELSTTQGIVVCHDVSLLISSLRRAKYQLPRLVDVHEALRLVSGISKDQGGAREWDTWRAAQRVSPNSAEIRRLSAVLDARVPMPEKHERDHLTQCGAVALRALWVDTLQKLSERGELGRFLDLEVPVQQVFHRREYEGIKIDGDVYASTLATCENDYYSSLKSFAQQVGYSPQSLSDHYLLESMLELPPDSASRADNGAREDFLELLAWRSQPAELLLQFVKGRRDLNVLKEVTTVDGRVFPKFQIHGTVTSRILVSEPRLQQLRKRFRAIVSADENMRLIYLDYAQFEPAILGALAADDRLLQAYSDSDLYVALLTEMDLDRSARDFAKRIFLSYLYGMSPASIATYIVGEDSNASNRQETDTKVRTFFARFSKLEQYRTESRRRLEEDGSVATLNGNHRRRISKGALSAKESRWALNHIVQGTASLIFKTAILKICDVLPFSAVLLPMHDAVLLQVTDDEVEQRRTMCIEAMRQAFSMCFPGVVAKVEEQPFAIPTRRG